MNYVMAKVSLSRRSTRYLTGGRDYTITNNKKSSTLLMNGWHISTSRLLQELHTTAVKRTPTICSQLTQIAMNATRNKRQIGIPYG